MASTSPTGSDPEIINHSTASISAPTQDDNSTPARPPPLSRASTAGREKCWICLSTKDEDLPSPPNPPTEWRSPCSCSLQAHEACLLDWVADQESPRSRSGGGRSGPTPDKILCPQCRSEIKIQRPFNPLVQLCRKIDRQYSRLVLPGVVTTVFGTVLAGCWAHGVASLYLVFGRRDAQRIILDAQKQGRGLVYSFALIPFSLIFSRNKWADFVLPVGTVTLLSTQLPAHIGDPLVAWDQPFWPPQPSTVFAVLPTLKSVYDWAYNRCFARLNQKWLDEIRPRREEGYQGQEDNIPDILNEAEAAENDAGDGGVVLELELNLGVEDDGNGRAEVNGANGNLDGADNEQGQQDANGNGDRRGHVHRLLGNDEFIDDTTSVGQQVVGSLLLPAASALAGQLLKYVLPGSWVSERLNFYPKTMRPGFFATQWGRSVVGGLALCGIKDILVLYCRWRIAESHKTRRIMNFDKSKKQYIAV